MATTPELKKTVKTKKKVNSKPSVTKLNSRWGKTTINLGYTAVPNILIERQTSLGLDSVKLNILLVLLKHWWEKPDMPFPTKKTICNIVSKDGSTVQKHIKQMEDGGLLKRIVRRRQGDSGGQMSNEYDLSGLVEKLKAYAVIEVKERKERKETEARRQRGNT